MSEDPGPEAEPAAEGRPRPDAERQAEPASEGPPRPGAEPPTEQATERQAAGETPGDVVAAGTRPAAGDPVDAAAEAPPAPAPPTFSSGDRFDQLMAKRRATGLTDDEARELGRLLAEREGAEHSAASGSTDIRADPTST